MSWNKNSLNHKYRRPSKFDFNSWMWNDYDDEHHWERYLWNEEMRYYDVWNCPNSMEQLVQYKLLTLLHRMDVNYAEETVVEMGLYL